MSLPLEQKAKDESQKIKISWNEGLYNYLSTRTSEKYELKANMTRRQECAQQTALSFPKITDEVLMSLYSFACLRYQQKCRALHGSSSGFYSTPSELDFAKTLASVIQKHPKLSHLEVYPSENQSKDLPKNFKTVVGNYVPDFLIFGLKIDGASAVAIEIDGDSHINKWSKDELRRDHLAEMKIFTWEIPNAQVKDMAFIEQAILKMYRLRNGSLNDQIKRAKRQIWTKTISCQLSLKEIEAYVYQEFLIQLNLEAEANVLKTMKGCPRKIKKELSRFLKS